MRKLKKLEKILRALGYDCGVVEDDDGPELRLYINNYQAYTVYDTGGYCTDKGVYLSTKEDRHKICKAIRQWLADEGLWEKFDSIQDEVRVLGFGTEMRDQHFDIWYKDKYIGMYMMNRTFLREQALYDLVPHKELMQLLGIFKRIDQEELARIERRARRKKA